MTALVIRKVVYIRGTQFSTQSLQLRRLTSNVNQSAFFLLGMTETFYSNLPFHVVSRCKWGLWNTSRARVRSFLMELSNARSHFERATRPQVLCRLKKGGILINFSCPCKVYQPPGDKSVYKLRIDSQLPKGEAFLLLLHPLPAGSHRESFLITEMVENYLIRKGKKKKKRWTQKMASCQSSELNQLEGDSKQAQNRCRGSRNIARYGSVQLHQDISF